MLLRFTSLVNEDVCKGCRGVADVSLACKVVQDRTDEPVDGFRLMLEIWIAEIIYDVFARVY